MTNLFAFKIENEDTESVSPILEKYTIRKIDDSFSKRQDEVSEKLDKIESKWEIPAWLAVLRIIAILLGAMLFITVVNAISDRGGDAFSSPATYIFLICGALLIAFGVLSFVLEIFKKKRLEESEEYKSVINEAQSLLKESEESLKIPNDRICVDIFYYPYQEKDGQIKKASLFKYLNHQLFLFKEEDMLCLADAAMVLGIKLEWIKRLVKNPDSVSFAGWNKEEGRNSEKYKAYRVFEDKLGILYIRNSVAIQLSCDGEEYEIIIPPYELEHFEALTGMRAVGTEM